MYSQGETLSNFQIKFIREITSKSAHKSLALQVYQNNFLYGLIDVLVAAYPLSYELLGKESFEAFAHDLVRRFPLHTGNRNDYGRQLGDILEGHEALSSVPWIADFARFEWAAHVAHHANDATPCSSHQLINQETRIALHPSVSLLILNHRVSPLYFAHLMGMEAPAPAVSQAPILVGRDQANAIFSLPLSLISLRFIEAIIATGSMAHSLDALNPSADEMSELQQFLSHCLQDGVLIPLNSND